MDGIFDSLVDDEEVEHGSPVLDVPDVELDTAFHLPELAGLAAEAVDLGPAGDAGLDEVAHHVLLDDVGVLFGVLQHVGTRTDDGHVAAEDVDELGQLVDAGLADELAYPRLAGIMERGLQAVGIGIDPHGTELVAPELTAVEPRTLLPEEDRTGRRELDGGAYDEVDEREDGAQEKPREQKVEATLDEAIEGIGQGFVADGQDRNIAQQLEIHAALEVVAYAGNAVKMHEMVFAIVDDGQNLLSVGRGQAAEHHFGRVFLKPGQNGVYGTQKWYFFRIDTGRGRSEISQNAETIGGIAGNGLVEILHVFVGADENDAAGVAATAAVALQGGAAGQAEGGQADEKREVEHEEETQRELSEIGQREKGAEDQGMQDDVADGPAYDVVGAHNAVVEDDAMGIVADQIDQIEQHQNLGNGVYKNES